MSFSANTMEYFMHPQHAGINAAAIKNNHAMGFIKYYQSAMQDLKLVLHIELAPYSTATACIQDLSATSINGVSIVTLRYQIYAGVAAMAITEYLARSLAQQKVMLNPDLLEEFKTLKTLVEAKSPSQNNSQQSCSPQRIGIDSAFYAKQLQFINTILAHAAGSLPAKPVVQQQLQLNALRDGAALTTLWNVVSGRI